MDIETLKTAAEEDGQLYRFAVLGQLQQICDATEANAAATALLLQHQTGMDDDDLERALRGMRNRLVQLW